MGKGDMPPSLPAQGRRNGASPRSSKRTAFNGQNNNSTRLPRREMIYSPPLTEASLHRRARDAWTSHASTYRQLNQDTRHGLSREIISFRLALIFLASNHADVIPDFDKVAHTDDRLRDQVFSRGQSFLIVINQRFENNLLDQFLSTLVQRYLSSKLNPKYRDITLFFTRERSHAYRNIFMGSDKLSFQVSLKRCVSQFRALVKRSIRGLYMRSRDPF